MLVAGLLLRDLRRGALIASSMVIVWFTYGHVEDLVAPMGVSRPAGTRLSERASGRRRWTPCKSR